MGREICRPDSAGDGVRMIFKGTKLRGAFIIEPERIEDERGFFARTFCRKEFELHGLNSKIVQCSVSYNKKRGTLRGMHYQTAPFQETKVVQCTMGAVYDVILDLRPDSPTFRQWEAVELSNINQRMVFVPEGCAHGFQCLEDDTAMFYQLSEFYDPGSALGVRWDDPAFKISWPLPVSVISKRDESFAFFDLQIC